MELEAVFAASFLISSYPNFPNPHIMCLTAVPATRAPTSQVSRPSALRIHLRSGNTSTPGQTMMSPRSPAHCSSSNNTIRGQANESTEDVIRPGSKVIGSVGSVRQQCHPIMPPGQHSHRVRWQCQRSVISGCMLRACPAEC
eukprot:scaffold161670_cov17-Tisochrysis_lutea.AAC.1